MGPEVYAENVIVDGALFKTLRDLHPTESQLRAIRVVEKDMLTPRLSSARGSQTGRKARAKKPSARHRRG
ncbi:hypothetical protein GCM10017709_33640 [Glutamicibacter nicotianae]